MGRDPEDVRAELEAFNPRARKKSTAGFERRCAEAWKDTGHGRWEQLTPQWQGYILKFAHNMDETR